MFFSFRINRDFSHTPTTSSSLKIRLSMLYHSLLTPTAFNPKADTAPPPIGLKNNTCVPQHAPTVCLIKHQRWYCFQQEIPAVHTSKMSPKPDALKPSIHTVLDDVCTLSPSKLEIKIDIYIYPIISFRGCQPKNAPSCGRGQRPNSFTFSSSRTNTSRNLTIINRLLSELEKVERQTVLG